MASYKRAPTQKKFMLVKPDTFLRTIKKGYIKIPQLLKTEAIKSVITIIIVIKQTLII